MNATSVKQAPDSRPLWIGAGIAVGGLALVIGTMLWVLVDPKEERVEMIETSMPAGEYVVYWSETDIAIGQQLREVSTDYEKRHSGREVTKAHLIVVVDEQKRARFLYRIHHSER